MKRGFQAPGCLLTDGPTDAIPNSAGGRDSDTGSTRRQKQPPSADQGSLRTYELRLKNEDARVAVKPRGRVCAIDDIFEMRLTEETNGRLLEAARDVIECAMWRRARPIQREIIQVPAGSPLIRPGEALAERAKDPPTLPSTKHRPHQHEAPCRRRPPFAATSPSALQPQPLHNSQLQPVYGEVMYQKKSRPLATHICAALLLNVPSGRRICAAFRNPRGGINGSSAQLQ